MKQSTFEKAQDLQNDIARSMHHLDTIDGAIKRGERVQFIISGCSRNNELDHTDVQPIDVDAFFNQYRANLVKKIAKLKRQFAAL